VNLRSEQWWWKMHVSRHLKRTTCNTHHVAVTITLRVFSLGVDTRASKSPEPARIHQCCAYICLIIRLKVDSFWMLVFFCEADCLIGVPPSVPPCVPPSVPPIRPIASLVCPRVFHRVRNRLVWDHGLASEINYISLHCHLIVLNGFRHPSIDFCLRETVL
jgi:hypothetical protein